MARPTGTCSSGSGRRRRQRDAVQGKYPAIFTSATVLTSSSGYACGNFNGQTCFQVMVSTTLPTISCDGTKSKTSTVTVPNSKASMADFTILAPMIQINWQATDRPASSTAPSRPPLTTGPAATSTSSSDSDSDSGPTDSSSAAQPTDTSTPAVGVPDANTDNPNPDDSQRKESESGGGGLATATKVGLGIGAGVAAIALVLGVVFYMWRRRHSRNQDDELDRLYGLKQIGPDAHSSTDLSGGGMKDDIPGWYRGQRPLQNTTGMGGVMMPTALSPSYMSPQGMQSQGMPLQGMSPMVPSGPANPYIDPAGSQAAAPQYRPYRPGV